VRRLVRVDVYCARNERDGSGIVPTPHESFVRQDQNVSPQTPRLPFLRASFLPLEPHINTHRCVMRWL
jgi:hypothetical protein